jgi:DNA-binding CsgD family transcriptional regulator
MAECTATGTTEGQFHDQIISGFRRCQCWPQFTFVTFLAEIIRCRILLIPEYRAWAGCAGLAGAATPSAALGGRLLLSAGCQHPELILGADRTTGRRKAPMSIQQIDLAGTARSPEPEPQLTPRQWQLLDLLAAGHTNAQIARRLGVSEGTVRTHLENIYRRLNVTNRTAAVMRAFTGHGSGLAASPGQRLSAG